MTTPRAIMRARERALEEMEQRDWQREYFEEALDLYYELIAKYLNEETDQAEPDQWGGLEFSDLPKGVCDEDSFNTLKEAMDFEAWMDRYHG